MNLKNDSNHYKTFGIFVIETQEEYEKRAAKILENIYKTAPKYITNEIDILHRQSIKEFE